MNKLREQRDLRLAFSIAGGVFGGLALYRILIWTHEWWDDLYSEQKSNFLIGAILLATAAGLVLGARWVLRRFKVRRWVAGVSILSAVLIATALVGVLHQLALEREGNQYLNQIDAQNHR
jgi:peptidoglycan/LPS O-acetylase OafA/YrhL